MHQAKLANFCCKNSWFSSDHYPPLIATSYRQAFLISKLLIWLIQKTYLFLIILIDNRKRLLDIKLSVYFQQVVRQIFLFHNQKIKDTSQMFIDLIIYFFTSQINIPLRLKKNQTLILCIYLFISGRFLPIMSY